jgi:hypothetical protein
LVPKPEWDVGVQLGAHPAQRPVEFYKPEFDVRNWKEIPVPSC